MNYYQAVWQKAVQDARAFWTAHRIITTLATPVMGFAGTAIIKKGLYSFLDVMEALGVSILSFLGGIVLTLLVSVVRAPALLDDAKQIAMRNANAEIAERAGEIERLNQALNKPPRTPVEEHHYQLAKSALEKHGQGAVMMLRHLRTHGKLALGSWFVPTLPNGMNKMGAVEILGKLKAEHLVNERFVRSEMGTDSEWEIAPGMIKALDDILYEYNPGAART